MITNYFKHPAVHSIDCQDDCLLTQLVITLMQTNTKTNPPTPSPSNTNQHLHELLFGIFKKQCKPEESDTEIELEIKVDNSGSIVDLELVKDS